ncbi:MAG: amylo-alpha-1,6-glucosidase [Bacteroidales bacterium]|jgi:predicted glycogen debranching enzyme|nr:amylo-alpha-1,6-glucosidase [Bacteroidales bacterium]MCI1733832.1 amylo-alpha-1,6-glucosidase [Bacteroidales bacterium]
MAYLEFNKEKLVNLEYSLAREILLSNRAGGYVNTTIVCCNTRKYHGLLVVPIDNFGGEKHILLSNIHESLVQHGKCFNLGIASYGAVYEPRGHKYIVDFQMNYSSTITYQVGDMLFSKTIMFVRETEEVLIKYTLLESPSTATLRLKPFLAFRNIHALTKANTDADTRFTPADNGVAFCMYKGFPTLNLQLSKKNDWVACPDWYYNIVYKEESRRGFDDREDLFVPGYFEVPIKKGESIILSASTSPAISKELISRFAEEIKKRDNRRNSYDDCMKIAGKQFIIRNNGEYSICSGYSWDYECLRDSFIALPGLTVYNDGDEEKFHKVMENACTQKLNQLVAPSNQPDTPLWMFKTLQEYQDWKDDFWKFNDSNKVDVSVKERVQKDIWKRYGKVMREILESFLDGRRDEIKLHGNGLLWAKKTDTALSWMNVYDVNKKPITERGGYQVEVNALWYNALCYYTELDEKFGDGNFARHIAPVIKSIKDNYYNYFWSEERGHLADYVDEEGQNIYTRPNQLMACSVPYSPIEDEVKMKVLESVGRELLTTRGIRTLSPKNPLYKGVYEGNQSARDYAHHNGCAYPWILGPYINSCLRLQGKFWISKGMHLIHAFEEDMTVHGIGTISEMYDGNPPFLPHGCISFANSVGELIRAKYMLSRFGSKEPLPVPHPVGAECVTGSVKEKSANKKAGKKRVPAAAGKVKKGGVKR